MTSVRKTYFVPSIKVDPSCSKSCKKITQVPFWGVMVKVSNMVFPPLKVSFK